MLQLPIGGFFGQSGWHPATAGFARHLSGVPTSNMFNNYDRIVQGFAQLKLEQLASWRTPFHDLDHIECTPVLLVHGVGEEDQHLFNFSCRLYALMYRRGHDVVFLKSKKDKRQLTHVEQMNAVVGFLKTAVGCPTPCTTRANYLVFNTSYVKW